MTGAGTGTYALLALPFFAIVAVVAVAAGVVAARRARARGRSASTGRRIAVVTGLVGGAVLLAMTIVFDNVIVGSGIVAYDPSRISGAKIGAIPIEDLAYAIAAVVLLPSLWVLFDRTDPRTGHDPQTGPTPRTAPDRPSARPEETP